MTALGSPVRIALREDDTDGRETWGVVIKDYADTVIGQGRKIQASLRPPSAAKTKRPSSSAIAHRSTGAQSRPRSELSMTVST